MVDRVLRICRNSSKKDLNRNTKFNIYNERNYDLAGLMKSEHRGTYFSCTVYLESKHNYVEGMKEIKEV